MRLTQKNAGKLVSTCYNPDGNYYTNRKYEIISAIPVRKVSSESTNFKTAEKVARSRGFKLRSIGHQHYLLVSSGKIKEPTDDSGMRRDRRSMTRIVVRLGQTLGKTVDSDRLNGFLRVV